MSVAERCAALTCSSTYQVATPMMQAGGKINSESWFDVSVENRRNSVSGLAFLDLDWYASTKSNQPGRLPGVQPLGSA